MTRTLHGLATAPLTLNCAGRPVARYEIRPYAGEDARRLSPRPFLHPVTTLAGTPVTEFAPADHPHHLGVGVAVPDVEGRNFWGGRTYVEGRGPTELDNHGEQRHRAFKLCDPDGFVEDLDWIADGCVPVLRERRTVAVTQLCDDAWALDFTFSLTNPADAALSIGSPATNGRPGAAYGGFFWRAPKEVAAPAVFTAAAEGESAVHGRPADWLAMAGDGWTLVLAGATAETRRDPWFVRTDEYPGVGSSLASAARLPIGPGDTAVRRVVTVVADGTLDRKRAATLVRKAVAA
ncbi:PmoA family protein [Streptomyces sp. NPDC051684]|uniref:PmoA family protein n=1 Tax=Streptomyces sp. NPDC051684 TaxID=3365670 RepID=UPI00379433B0